MNKNILAIAIAAAVAAPSAFAAATVYGLAHMSVDSVSNVKKATGGTDDNFGQVNVASNSSRLGIKGSEDLGGGLKAVYQYETTIGWDGDTNGGTGGMGTQRNTFVGLGGGFGTVLLGIHDTPLKMVGRKYDFFGDQVGDFRNFTRANGTGLGFDERPGNVIAYMTPTFSGVSAGVAYVNDENGSADKANFTTSTGTAYSNDTSAISAMLNYKVAKFEASLAYETHGKSFTSAAAATADKNMSAVRLGASYDFGMVNVKGFYANQDNLVAQDSVKARNIYGIGAGVKVGAAGTVKAQIGMAEKLSGVADSGATLYAVGYDHAMSKNTTAYAAYSMVDNQAEATFSAVGGGGHSGATSVNKGKDPSAISVGIIHKF
jgi:predicted porin